MLSAFPDMTGKENDNIAGKSFIQAATSDARDECVGDRGCLPTLLCTFRGDRPPELHVERPE